MAIRIGGAEICFPDGLRPFPSQMGLMNQLLRAANAGQPALLESPTGTGKTLALLASTLAWLKKERKRIILAKAKVEMSKRYEAEVAQQGANLTTVAEVSVTAEDEQLASKPMPKVYFASRTHSQLRQVVSELKRLTSYHEWSVELPPDLQPAESSVVTSGSLSMTILAGRRHYCIHDVISKLPNVDEACRQAVRVDHSCPHSDATMLATRLQHRTPPVWDIEDAIAESTAGGGGGGRRGKRSLGCPFFASRDLLETADLVLLPYQYLVEPIIRNAMSLNAGLNGAIVVIDEAHNIESCAREAASCEVSAEDVAVAAGALWQACDDADDCKQEYKALWTVIERVRVWMSCQLRKQPHPDAAMAAIDRRAKSRPGSARLGPEVLSLAEGAAAEATAGFWGVVGAASDGEPTLAALWECLHRVGAREDTLQSAANERGPEEGSKPRLLVMSAILSEQQPSVHAASQGRRAAEGGGRGAAGGGAGSGWAAMPGGSQDGVVVDYEGAVGGQQAEKRRTKTLAGGRALQVVERLLVSLAFMLEGSLHSQEQAKQGPEASQGSEPQPAPVATPGTAHRRFLGTFRLAVTDASASPRAGFRSRGDRRRSAFQNEEAEQKLCLWCLRAEVAFRALLDRAHAVFLTSGTLSPIGSFESELGVPFPYKLEARHCVDVTRQVCALTVPMASNGFSLKGTYHEANRPEYRAAIGQTLLQLCRSTPGGVLVFFPSYSLLAKCRRAWIEDGTQWQDLVSEKLLCCEPRRQDDLDAVLHHFRIANGLDPVTGKAAVPSAAEEGAAEEQQPSAFAAIMPQSAAARRQGGGRRRQRRGGRRGRDSDRDPFAPVLEDDYDPAGDDVSPRRSTQTGALLLSVFRGKCSEGIDFRDNAARCVVLIGIPYPAFMDAQVQLKRDYQDRQVSAQQRAGRASQPLGCATPSQRSQGGFLQSPSGTPVASQLLDSLAGGSQLLSPSAPGHHPPGKLQMVSSSAASLPASQRPAAVAPAPMTGAAWYEIEAFRALNQALGRCVRHQFDYGAVVFLDARFTTNKKLIPSLSRWVRDVVRPVPSSNEAVAWLRRFFVDAEQYASAKEVRFRLRLARAAFGAGVKPEPAMPSAAGVKLEPAMPAAAMPGPAATAAAASPQSLSASPTSIVLGAGGGEVGWGGPRSPAETGVVSLATTPSVSTTQSSITVAPAAGVPASTPSACGTAAARELRCRGCHSALASFATARALRRLPASANALPFLARLRRRSARFFCAARCGTCVPPSEAGSLMGVEEGELTGPVGPAWWRVDRFVVQAEAAVDPGEHPTSAALVAAAQAVVDNCDGSDTEDEEAEAQAERVAPNRRLTTWCPASRLAYTPLFCKTCFAAQEEQMAQRPAAAVRAAEAGDVPAPLVAVVVEAAAPGRDPHKLNGNLIVFEGAVEVWNGDRSAAAASAAAQVRASAGGTKRPQSAASAAADALHRAAAEAPATKRGRREPQARVAAPVAAAAPPAAGLPGAGRSSSLAMMGRSALQMLKGQR